MPQVKRGLGRGFGSGAGRAMGVTNRFPGFGVIRFDERIFLVIKRALERAGIDHEQVYPLALLCFSEMNTWNKRYLIAVASSPFEAWEVLKRLRCVQAAMPSLGRFMALREQVALAQKLTDDERRMLLGQGREYDEDTSQAKRRPRRASAPARDHDRPPLRRSKAQA